MADRRKRATPRPPSPRVARRRRIVARVLLGTVLAIALLFVFVFPARSLLDQRQKEDKARSVLDLLRRENAQLERQSKRLQDDAEIERIAREQYGLVRPGEQPYALVPPATTTLIPATPEEPTGSTPTTTAPR